MKEIVPNKISGRRFLKDFGDNDTRGRTNTWGKDHSNRTARHKLKQVDLTHIEDERDPDS